MVVVGMEEMEGGKRVCSTVLCRFFPLSALSSRDFSPFSPFSPSAIERESVCGVEETEGDREGEGEEIGLSLKDCA